MEQKDISGSEDASSLYSRINLVDLAGSERVAKTGAEGDTLVEASSINKRYKLQIVEYTESRFTV